MGILELLKKTTLPQNHKASLIDQLEDTGVFDKRMEEPPKRWYNWVVALYSVTTINGIHIPAGGVTTCWREPRKPPHPSKEVAEELARVIIESDRTPDGAPLFRYLGAFPEGKLPPGVQPL